MSQTSKPAGGDGGGTVLQRFMKSQWALLSFRSSPIAPVDRGNFLAFALGITWLAGIGRYWDHPSAQWWQYAGSGSVAYVFVLAGLLWLVGLPLRIFGWKYSGVLLFVCMTSPPALLYAIPVERFLPLYVAQDVNFWFLAVVAAWRVGLLLRFLAVPCGLGAGALVVTLLPLCVIVLALSAFNLEQATFEIMATGETQETPHDGAYAAVVMMSIASIFAVVPLVACYAWIAVNRRRSK